MVMEESYHRMTIESVRYSQMMEGNFFAFGGSPEAMLTAYSSSYSSGAIPALDAGNASLI
ncbi:hypothetical protein [Butyrivibrio sp. INlla14]|uniref:hypothetical protein n=1 Tax=Butyrivibrio sp. INlla14 TaxID=1520808 RepID=UPI0008763158|nr:hypothetical protein [Butyrivibrio sp. INlla14]SCY11353.1 hypothetical protein SAMN02910371_01113 [Butyrivibrio sp. INlla14]